MSKKPNKKHNNSKQTTATASVVIKKRDTQVNTTGNNMQQETVQVSLELNTEENCVVQEPDEGIRTQKYALRAYPKVEKQHGKAIEAKYRTIALNFPTLVLQSGLAQAIGFLLAKAGDEKESEHQKYLEDLANVLGFQANGDNSVGNVLHSKVIYAELAEYQLLTRKTLEASAWLKRYTQSLLEGAK